MEVKERNEIKRQMIRRQCAVIRMKTIITRRMKCVKKKEVKRSARLNNRRCIMEVIETAEESAKNTMI